MAMSLATHHHSVSVPVDPRLVSQLPKPPGALRAITERVGSTVIVRAGGEVDAANDSSWRRLLREASAAAIAPGLLVVDADGLDFMGLCAFSVLAEEADRCRARGVRICLVSRNALVARIMVVGDFRRRMDLYPDVHTALTAASS
jgi:anti-anti-sigma factor